MLIQPSRIWSPVPFLLTTPRRHFATRINWPVFFENSRNIVPHTQFNQTLSNIEKIKVPAAVPDQIDEIKSLFGARSSDPTYAQLFNAVWGRENLKKYQDHCNGAYTSLGFLSSSQGYWHPALFLPLRAAYLIHPYPNQSLPNPIKQELAIVIESFSLLFGTNQQKLSYILGEFKQDRTTELVLPVLLENHAFYTAIRQDGKNTRIRIDNAGKGIDYRQPKQFGLEATIDSRSAADVIKKILDSTTISSVYQGLEPLQNLDILIETQQTPHCVLQNFNIGTHIRGLSDHPKGGVSIDPAEDIGNRLGIPSENSFANRLRLLYK